MINKTYANNKIISLLDLTSLNDDDNNQVIEELCNNASNNTYAVASVCIYPKFIPIAKAYFAKFQQTMNITTVVNFPTGQNDEATTLKELEHALHNGADEIDVVIPYKELIANVKNANTIEKFVATIKKNCGKKTLKTIIESGELKEEKLIRLASKIAINGGTNFIKTSTGKVPINATPQAAQYMLEEIKNSNSKCGFKAAGGVKNKVEALEYLNLAEHILGEKFITAKTFRFGASSLLHTLLGSDNNTNSY